MSADFESFFGRRAEAASAYVNGDAAPLQALLTPNDEASFHSPGGDSVTGAKTVANRYEEDAKRFAPGSTSRLDVLQKATGDIAFWTGFQDASVHLAGKDEPVAMRIRVTEVFRHEDGDWKLIHRHADMAGSGRK
ncbi:MAG: nuclear transport factor 2 family protein [Pseudomonadota bacterium]|uniref:YybH family protein n=1 Tax=Sphingomonas sp. ERG5 TaxID=1381597 RepID=UPI000ABC9842|nr:nuclear transport factor 2 family protein [Sphingomonas sp. ERG5]